MKTRVFKQQSIITPEQLLAEMPATDEQRWFVINSVRTLGRIITKRDKRIATWIGGCSTDNPDHAEATADFIRVVQPMFPNLWIGARVFGYKGRSEVTEPITHWEGSGYDPHHDNSYDYELGLRWNREALLRVIGMEVPTLVDFIDLITPDYLLDLITQIVAGARFSQTADYRRLASEVAAGAALKNPTSGNLKVGVQSVATAMKPQIYPDINKDGRCLTWSMGNPYAHLVLRGGDTGPNYDAEHVAEATMLLRERGIENGLGIDPGHQQCNKNPDLVPTIIENGAKQRYDGNNDIVEFIIEMDLDGRTSRTDRGISQMDMIKCLEMLNHAVR